MNERTRYSQCCHLNDSLLLDLFRVQAKLKQKLLVDLMKISSHLGGLLWKRDAIFNERSFNTTPWLREVAVYLGKTHVPGNWEDAVDDIQVLKKISQNRIQVLETDREILIPIIQMADHRLVNLAATSSQLTSKYKFTSSTLLEGMRS